MQSTADGCLKNALSLAGGKLIPQLLQILPFRLVISKLNQDTFIKKISFRDCVLLVQRILSPTIAVRDPSKQFQTHDL